MGRGKIEIKRIENSNNRQVTYSKRRNGIVKKAKEISVLCDAQVSLVIFASSGKMHEYVSPNSSLINILDAYQKQSGTRLWDAKHENLSNEIERIKKENDNMQNELRHLKGEDINSLHHKELMSIEDALENGLTCIRERQMEIYRMAKKNFADKERLLEDENKRLTYQMHQVMDMEGGEMENEYQYQPQMPFSFRVQPIQPNLHERF
uniref:MADS-box transcription factor n=1 Tax=Cyclamen persicum TaxID=87530 RepID=F1T120_9ERIC|nr:MADS-box transcription factor [Cyclamen persicum]